MQPISPLATAPMTPPRATLASPAPGPGGFYELWQSALRRADALAAAPASAAEVQRVALEASQACDRLLAAYREITDLRY